MQTFAFFATAPLGLELLLVDELRSLGISNAKEVRAGVSFEGSLEDAYRVCLWSRLANRVLLKLGSFPAADSQALYDGIAELDWAEQMSPDNTLAVDFSASRSEIRHTQYGAQTVKDAIVDQFRALCGIRPSVRLDRPDVRVNVYLDKNIAQISLDLSGESLHKRGYRLEGGAAPLKENLAAAILLRAQWPKMAEAGGELLDPMCGSGTLLIEGAWMAADIAPGIMREYFGFQAWKNHQASVWENLINEARSRREQGLAKLGQISGCDQNPSAIHAALENIHRAGLRGLITLERKSAANARPHQARGLLVVNPPYGERMGEAQELVSLYSELGNTLKTHFQGWNASVFTGNPDLSFKVGIRAKKFYKLYNGALECKLFNFEIEPERFFIPHADETGLSEEMRKSRQLMRRAQSLAQGGELGPGAEMFANRLHKNLKNLGRWARQSGVSCYRLYDADLPEYALAIDLYQGDSNWLHVQEYEAPISIDPVKAEARLTEALAVLTEALDIPSKQIYFKIRRRQKGNEQYEKRGETSRFYTVEEGGCKFLVNFEDYLDTGLFLDHRPTRMMIQQIAKDKHFLNLFAYTASASVHAAQGGAASTTSVDMSRTYLDWARKNFDLNGIKGYQHELVQADCLAWLDQTIAQRESYFDLIFLDPPTFSNSKRMEASFDIQRDHPQLLRKTAKLLRPEGLLLFSTNFRRFKIDAQALEELGFSVENLGGKTIGKDFERNPKIHHCFAIRSLR